MSEYDEIDLLSDDEEIIEEEITEEEVHDITLEDGVYARDVWYTDIEERIVVKYSSNENCRIVGVYYRLNGVDLEGSSMRVLSADSTTINNNGLSLAFMNIKLGSRFEQSISNIYSSTIDITLIIRLRLPDNSYVLLEKEKPVRIILGDSSAPKCELISLTPLGTTTGRTTFIQGVDQYVYVNMKCSGNFYINGEMYFLINGEPVSIYQYDFFNDMQTTNSNLSSTFTCQVILPTYLSGELTVECWVEDKFGRSSKKQQVTIDVVKYHAPIAYLSATRYLEEACENRAVDGEWVKITTKCVYSEVSYTNHDTTGDSIVSNNISQAFITLKKKIGTSIGTFGTIVLESDTVHKVSNGVEISEVVQCADDLTINIDVYYQDSLCGSLKSIKISPPYVLMNIDANGKGIGFGQMATSNAKRLTVGAKMPLYVNSNIYLDTNAKAIYGVTSAGESRRNIIPCNSSDNLVLGYGSYESNDGDSLIYGKNLKGIVTNDIEFRPINDFLIKDGSNLTDSALFAISAKNRTNVIRGLSTTISSTTNTIGGTATTISSTTTNITGTLKINNRTYGTNKTLATAAYRMNSTQEVTLSEAISSQPNGIVLIFSHYDSTNSVAEDVHFTSFFVPKSYVSTFSGKGMFFSGSHVNHTYSWAKYLFISDTKITGHDSNKKASTVGSDGVTYDNSQVVLRRVIGV